MKGITLTAVLTSCLYSSTSCARCSSLGILNRVMRSTVPILKVVAVVNVRLFPFVAIEIFVPVNWRVEVCTLERKNGRNMDNIYV